MEINYLHHLEGVRISKGKKLDLSKARKKNTMWELRILRYMN